MEAIWEVWRDILDIYQTIQHLNLKKLENLPLVFCTEHVELPTTDTLTAPELFKVMIWTLHLSVRLFSQSKVLNLDKGLNWIAFAFAADN